MSRTLTPLLGATALGALLALGRAARGVPTAIGASERQLRAAAAGSPHATDGYFRNTEAGSIIKPGGLATTALTRGRGGRPSRPIPIVAMPAPATAAPLAVTWFGHSSVLVEIDGHRVLADPVWSERASPSRVLGPRRLHPIPVPLEELPAVDAVLISHDHYDHLDLPTVAILTAITDAPFVVPLGIGAHLRRWSVPEHRILELDWDGDVTIGSLTITCVEARHFSGRSLTRNTTQWSSWAIGGPRHRVYFGGDTGYTCAFSRTADRIGPFDVTLLPIGAYSDHWPDIHMTPEQAVQAHADLTGPAGGLLVPVHWATFDLAFHPWSEPPERLCAAATAAATRIAIPRPGERVHTQVPAPVRDWWNGVV